MSNDHFGDHEDANTRACQEAAQAAGITAEQADNCDNGEHKCPACPWRRDAVSAQPAAWCRLTERPIYTGAGGRPTYERP